MHLRNAPRAASRREDPFHRGALVGAFLITAAALGAFAVDSGSENGPTTRYLVTTRAIEIGERLSTTDVQFEAMTLSDELADRSLNSTNGLDGATVLRTFRDGLLRATTC